MAERTSSRGMDSSSHRSSWSIRMPLKFLGRLKHRFKTGFSWEKFFREHDPADFTEPDAAASNHAPPSPVPAAPLYCPSTPVAAAAAGLNDHEAIGSNPTSEYFDALDRPEYVAQQAIPNYSRLHRPSFPEVDTRFTYYTPQEQGPQRPGYNTGTPTSEYPAMPVNTDPVTEIYYSGELFPDATTEANFSQYSTDVDATSNSRYANGSSISFITGDTIENGEGMIDTGASTSSYVLPPDPVAEEHRSLAQYIVGVGRFLIGSEYRYQYFPRPRGRGVRVLARIVCAFQAGKRLMKMIRMKKRRATGHLSARHKKRIKARGSPVPRLVPGSPPRLETGVGFKGVKIRPNGKWKVEKRVSMAGKSKCWVGTFNSATEAALAYDAAVFHCTEKKKQVENLNFPELRKYLEPSRYSEVLKLCQAGCKKLEEEAKTLVKSLAAAHAARAANV